jgi:hypothetical protein
MKKLLLAVFAISMVALMAPNPSLAEPTHPNELGLYASPDDFTATGTDVIGAPVYVYLVLTRPEAIGAPTAGLAAFECQLNFSPAGGIFKTGEILPGEGFNIGDASNIQDGYLEYIVGFADLIPTVDEAILCLTLQFININTVPVEVTLGPPSFASIPNQMSFFPGDPPLEIMYSMGGSHDAPVFIFSGMAIPVEEESFGSVKALYR